MKKCTYCGKEYSDDAVVCAIDSQPLRIVKAEQKPPPSLPTQASVQQPTARPVADMKVALTIGFSVLLLLVGGLIQFAMGMAVIESNMRVKNGDPVAGILYSVNVLLVIVAIMAGRYFVKNGKLLWVLLFCTGLLPGFFYYMGWHGMIDSFKKLRGEMPFQAKSPDGSSYGYTLEQLRQDFLNGKVTTEWVVRKQEDPAYRPVSEILYPPK